MLLLTKDILRYNSELEYFNLRRIYYLKTTSGNFVEA